MRTLYFKAADPRYDLCFESITSLPATIFPLQAAEIDTHVALVRQFKLVGNLQNPERTAKDAPIYVCAADAAVKLENAEYDLLKRMVGTAGPYVARWMTELFVETRDWLTALPVDPPVTMISNNAGASA